MNLPPLPTDDTWVVAHRGARDEAPENTRSAFERALRYPIDGIELDVRMSADGVPVIHHDATLWRVARSRRRVADLTTDQLARVDWGAWFDGAFAGEPLLTLEETLDRFAARTRLLIEIKAPDNRDGADDRLTRRVLDRLARLPAQASEAHIHILCFDIEVLRLAYRLAPQWRCVYNMPGRHPEQVMRLPEAATADLWAVDVPIGRLTPRLAAWARDRGLKLFTYTCNGPRQVARALRLGVDAILTDHPGWLTGYMGRRG